MHREMNKGYAILITVLFLGLIYGFGILHIVQKDKVFSEQENRNLAQTVSVSAEGVLSGSYMRDIEEYVSDQFPLRDSFVTMKAAAERIMGKQENNSVYFGTDKETLFAQYTAPALSELSKQVSYVNQLGESLSIPVFFSLIPDKTFVLASHLPEYAYLTDDGSVLRETAKICSDSVTYIDLLNSFSGEDSFYKTDHHWTTYGAYQGYQTIGTAMRGTYTISKDKLLQVSDDFYGTTWSASGAGWIKPDCIDIMVLGNDYKVTSYRTGTAEEALLYDSSFLEKKDQYAMFLGGNQPLCVIKNDTAASKEKLLLIRDSFADSLAPFLAQDYEEVHLLDLRYYKGSVLSYIEENDIDSVLVLYSDAEFISDSNLFLMTQ